MLRPAALALALSAASFAPTTLRSQTPDTAAVRATYARVVAFRDSMERAHGHFVAVDGIRMHYLEWGDPKGRPPRLGPRLRERRL